MLATWLGARAGGCLQKDLRNRLLFGWIPSDKTHLCRKARGEQPQEGENIQMYEGVWTGPQSVTCGGAANGQGTEEAHRSKGVRQGWKLESVSSAGRREVLKVFLEGPDWSDLFFRKIPVAELQRKA